MIVADYIAKFLVAKGVKHVFGFQGSAMLKMLDSIVSTGSIEYIQGFHEQASAFAADAYARVSGMPGVAIATSGPGASNLVTGIANAYYDSVPVFFLTGQDRRSHIGSERKSRQNGFQDMDIVSMVRKITKRAVQVFDGISLKKELDECWNIALDGRKGPVLIDVPIDLQFEQMPEVVSDVGDGEASQISIDTKQIKAALDLLNSSSRPVVLVGGGVRLAGACQKLETFISRTHIPAVSTLMGLDATKNTLGFSGIFGNALPNRILKEADCILALGTRFAFHHTGKNLDDYSSARDIVHVDVDASELGRVYGKALCVNMDVLSFLDVIDDGFESAKIIPWVQKIADWRQHGDSAPGFSTDFLKHLFSIMPENSIVTADVGSNQMLVAQTFAPSGFNRLLNSGGLGAMGYSLPAAIGASYAAYGPVVAVCGDGGVQMNLQELNTLFMRRCNVKVFVLNNSVLGLMRKIQSQYYGARFWGNTSKEFSCPDLCKLADVFGLKSARISSVEDFAKLNDIFADSESWIVDVVVDVDDIAQSRYEGAGCHE